MTVIRQNTPLEIIRIRPHHQHIFIVIGFQNDRFGTAQGGADLLCDTAHVGGNRRDVRVTLAAYRESVADTASAVVRDGK